MKNIQFKVIFKKLPFSQKKFNLWQTPMKEYESRIKTAQRLRTCPAKHGPAHKSPFPKETLVLNFFTQFKALYPYIYNIQINTHIFNKRIKD